MASIKAQIAGGTTIFFMIRMVILLVTTRL